MKRFNYLLQFFSFKHLPDSLKETSEKCHDLAQWVEHNVKDNPEKSAGMRKLLEAKDCFVRAQIFKEGE